MKWLHENIVTVNVPIEAVKRAHIFSQQVITTINYTDSNQTRLNKIRDDHFVSKIGEEAAKEVISGYGKVTGPDYAIYKGDFKSWDDDLMINNIGIAVKTQRRTNALKYGLSWTFQSGQIRRDTILDNPNAWVIFVEYNDQLPYNCNVFPPFQVKQLVFGEPRLQYLKSHKKVIYAHTLPIVTRQ